MRVLYKIGIFLLASVTIMFFSCKSPTSSHSSSTSSTTNSMLKAYGVNTSLGSPTDSSGNTLSSTSNPLGSQVSVPYPRKQIYLSGLTYSGVNSDVLGWNTGSSTYSSLYSQSDAAWAKNPHASVGVLNLSTGKERIVSVVFTPTTNSGAMKNGADNQGTISLRVWDGTTENVYTPLGSTSYHIYTGDYGNSTRSLVHITSGDFKGNGSTEVAVVVGNYVAVISADFTSTLFTKDFSDKDTSKFHPTCIAAGDVNSDGISELVVADGKHGGEAQCYIYGGTSITQIYNGYIKTTAATLQFANVALGDIDGDGTKDILFAGDDGSGYSLLAANCSTTNQITYLAASHHQHIDSGDWGDNPLVPLVCFNPDKKTEVKRSLVMVYNNIFEYTVSNTTSSFTSGYANLTTVDLPQYDLVAAADTHYDGREELILEHGNAIEVYGIDSSSSLGKLSSTSVTSDSNYYQSLCAGDVAGQSLVLQYESRALKYANPQIIAVLASPPYYADNTSAAVGNAGTSITNSTSTGTETSNSLTVSASFTIGFEAETPLEGDAFKTSLKTTIGTEFTSSYSSSSETTISHAYTTLAGQDAVLYTVVPFDVYTYKILMAPNSSSVGTEMTVDVPRSPQTLIMEKNTFNALSTTLNVGSTILSHTIGKPSTYPTKAAISSAVDYSTANVENGGGFWDSTGMTCGSGQNISTDTISKTSTSSTTEGSALSVNTSAEVVVAGAIFGADVGFSTSYDYTVTSSTSTELSGAVPGVTSSSDSTFDFGIASYQVLDSTIQTKPFMVITYWVGNASSNSRVPVRK